MDSNEEGMSGSSWYECPKCGNTLPHEPWLARFDAPCTECGYHLWCRRRFPATGTELEVLPERTPEPCEIQQLVEALVAKGAHTSVRLDMSLLKIVDSAFVARLVSMNRSIRESGGRLILHGMCSIIREMFIQLRLTKAFEIVEDD